MLENFIELLIFLNMSKHRENRMGLNSPSLRKKRSVIQGAGCVVLNQSGQPQKESVIENTSTVNRAVAEAVTATSVHT